jgi:hypothetical protein
MNFNDLTKELTTSFKIPPVVVGNNGTCHLLVDDMPISLCGNDDFVKVDAFAGFVDIDNEAYLEDLLSGNLIGRKTGGAVLSMGPGHQVNLSLRLQLTSLTPRSAIHLLERFVNNLNIWRSQLKHLDTTAVSLHGSREVFSGH